MRVDEESSSVVLKMATSEHPISSIDQTDFGKEEEDEIDSPISQGLKDHIRDGGMILDCMFPNQHQGGTNEFIEAILILGNDSSLIPTFHYFLLKNL